MTEVRASLGELLERLAAVGGSDLHLKVGAPPTYRIDGVLRPAELPALTQKDTEDLLLDLLPDRFLEDILTTSDFDFAYGEPGLGRFRVNFYRQRGSANIVVRAVATASQTLVDLGLPLAVAKACDETSGLIIVAGPAGSGKTTTCAAMVDHINTTRRASIITIEDPIEVLHRDKLSIVSQREVGVDTASYSEGMATVLRQDPDVIYVGELRGQTTIEAALVAAETGQLVISTMYTLNSMETVHRILDSFPPYLERRVRQMLATSLRAIVSQQLLPKADGHGRVVVAEVLLNVEPIQERLVEPDRTGTIPEVVAEGAFFGMQTIDQAILQRFKAGEVSFSDALSHVTSPRDFKIAAGIAQAPTL